MHPRIITGAQPRLQAAEPALHAFWEQLAATTELTQVDGSDFLLLGAGACFPLEGSNVANKLLVRQSYKDLHALMLQHFDRQGRSFIITGNPGEVICYRTYTGELYARASHYFTHSCTLMLRHWQELVPILSAMASGSQ
jgi:hypothetical protein